jgi:hypothetical protein
MYIYLVLSCPTMQIFYFHELGKGRLRLYSSSSAVALFGTKKSFSIEMHRPSEAVIPKRKRFRPYWGRGVGGATPAPPWVAGGGEAHGRAGGRTNSSM